MSINRVVLAGTVIGSDVRQFGQGNKVVTVTIEIDDKKWDSASGAMTDIKAQVKFDAFNSKFKKLADICAGAKPGDLLLLDGKVKLDTWENKNTGGQSSATKVIAENVEIFPGNGSYKPQKPIEKPEPPKAAKQPSLYQDSEGNDQKCEESIPFSWLVPLIISSAAFYLV